jgi:large subunit ribosomal protein L11e
MDFYAVMDRPGARIAKRRRAKARIGAPHRVHKEDTQAWFKQRFDGCVRLVSLRHVRRLSPCTAF